MDRDNTHKKLSFISCAVYVLPLYPAITELITKKNKAITRYQNMTDVYSIETPFRIESIKLLIL